MDERFERRVDARLIAAMAAAGSLSFCAVVFETAMNVALPALMAEFSVDTATIQWITSGYLLMLSVFIPVFPYLKGRFPLRRLFVSAVALFLLGTLLCGLAPVFPVLLAGRLIQGVGTGIAIPLMFSLVVDQAPYERMGLMMGFASLITALAPAVGPSYGGAVMSIASWRWVFLALVPVVAVAAAVGVASIRQATALRREAFDSAGFILIALGFFALVLACNVSSRAGWLSAPVLGLLVLSMVSLAVFAVHARRSDHPLVDVTMFSCAPFTCEVLVVALVSFAILGLAYLVPNYAQLALGASAFTAGTLLLPGCLASVLLGPIGGRLLDGLGARVPIILGMVLLVASAAGYVITADRLTPGLMMGIYVLFGAGQGFGFSTTMTNGLACLPEEQRTAGNSAFNTLQQLGGSLGVSVITAVVGAAQGQGGDVAAATASGGATAFIVLMGVMIGAAILSAAAFLLPSRHRGR